MELKSSDDAKILDLGSMMATQDNPERKFQIYEIWNLPSWGLIPGLLGYVDMKLDLIIWWLQYDVQPDLSLKGWSLLQISKLESWDLVSSSSSFKMQQWNMKLVEKLHCTRGRDSIHTEIWCNNLQADGNNYGEVRGWSLIGFLTEMLEPSFLLWVCNDGLRNPWWDCYW